MSDILAMISILAMVGLWVRVTSRVGADMILSGAGPALGWVVWLTAIAAGGVLGEYASLWMGLTWR